MESFEDILSRMVAAYEEASGCRVEDVSDIGLRLRVLAGELYRAQCEADWVRRQSFPQTAEGPQLDLHGAQRGLCRKGAQRAKGEITFSRYLPVAFDLPVPKGTLCAASGEGAVEYETTQAAVLAAGENAVTVPAQAVEPGAQGNAAAGAITTLVTEVSGIQYASNREAFTGGREEEDEASYRARVVEAYRRPPVLGNAAYYEQIALSVPGVTSAQAVADAETPGAVTLYLWGDGAPPDEATLALAAETLEEKKALGAVLTVQGAKERKINILLRVALPEGMGLDEAKEKVGAALGAYLRTRRVGDAVPAGEVLQAALEVLPGLAKVELPQTMQNYTAQAGSMPVAGSLTAVQIT